LVNHIPNSKLICHVSALTLMNIECRYSPEAYKVDVIMSVLRLSVFLDIKDGEPWALMESPRLATFTSALKLEVAQRYRVDHWVEPAFWQLMRTPLHEFEMTNVLSIGLPYYRIIVKTKAQIDDHRWNITFRAPDVINDIFCKTKMACSISWSMEWWRGITKQLLHPDATLTGWEMLVALDDVHLPHMCLECQQQSIDWVKSTGAFIREETMVDEAVNGVMKLQTDEPIWASLRNMMSNFPLRVWLLACSIWAEFMLIFLLIHNAFRTV